MDNNRPSALQQRLQARREMFMKETNLKNNDSSGANAQQQQQQSAQPIYSGSKQGRTNIHLLQRLAMLFATIK